MAKVGHGFQFAEIHTPQIEQKSFGVFLLVILSKNTPCSGSSEEWMWKNVKLVVFPKLVESSSEPEIPQRLNERSHIHTDDKR